MDSGHPQPFKSTTLYLFDMGVTTIDKVYALSCGALHEPFQQFTVV
eukprot:SAG31_NODE_499_length_14841_cov_7.930471_19_plen_46_part_00